MPRTHQTTRAGSSPAPFGVAISLWATACALAACTSNPPPIAIAVTLSPTTITLAPGAQEQFTAIVTGTAITGVTWTVTPLGGGVISTSGLYTAPDTPGTFAVHVTSEVTTAAAASATVIVAIPGADAGSDGGSDAGADAGMDGGTDAGTDAGSDAGTDGGGADGGHSDAGSALLFTSFSASPVDIVTGQSTTLSWNVSGETSLSLATVGGASSSVTGSSTQRSPSTSTTYLLTASNGSQSITLPASVTVGSATPAPLIEAFAADNPTILTGHMTTLRWTVVNATQVTISGLGTVAAAGSQSISPAATTMYMLTAMGAGGSASASASVTVNTSPQLTPVDPGSGDILLTLDSSLAIHPISPYIYGYNAGTLADAPPGTAFLRLGGNRWTAYNWETNASNAGSDYLYESDDYLGGGSTPAGALAPTIASVKAGNAGLLVTIPIQGWVSADEAGPVNVSAPNIDRFYPTAPRKDQSFASGPDKSDDLVFGDELANSVAQSFGGAGALAFSLDNEPDLWSSTHAEIEKSPVTYQELFDKSVGMALALKDAVPSALIYGPVSYGWAGFINLQNASDANNRDFLQTYLQTMEAQSRAQGRRLLDVFDVHWYSEATGGGTRVTTDDNSAAVVAARVQSSRSLWDSTYVEDSWITQDSTGNTAIELLPRLNGKIAAAFPGTKISLSEYDHGGGDDISGTIVEADALGIFGEQNIYSATYWPLDTDESFTTGAFRVYRDYDGNNATFGNTSFSALSSNVAQVSVYASMNAGHPEQVVAVIINRDTGSHTVDLVLRHSQLLSTATVWQITKANQSGSTVLPKLISSATPLSSYNATSIVLPAMSVSTVVLQ